MLQGLLWYAVRKLPQLKKAIEFSFNRLADLALPKELSDNISLRIVTAKRDFIRRKSKLARDLAEVQSAILDDRDLTDAGLGCSRKTHLKALKEAIYRTSGNNPFTLLDKKRVRCVGKKVVKLI